MAASETVKCVLETKKFVSSETDLFKKEFKKYRLEQNVVEVADFKVNCNLERDSDSLKISIEKFLLSNKNTDVEPDFTQHFLPVQEWKAYSIKEYPGVIFIRNPFLHAGQRYWVKRCLHDYPSKPNVTNLDTCINAPYLDDLWQNSHYLNANMPSKKSDLMDKLRWVTLGYHHNWNTKIYSANSHSPFPEDLAKLSQFVASLLGYPDYVAEASIVNYYHLNSTLSGHVDRSEFYTEMPIISFSFGQTAVFLVGGQTKAVKPLAMFLRSGDIVVLSGQSRLAYHAVPKILDCDNDEVQDIFSEAQPGILQYLKSSRINMNVRQVLAPGQCFPS